MIESVSGTIVAASNFVALLVPPLAGTLSDRTHARKGRRRPFLISGIIGTCVALALLVPFHAGSSVVVYGLVILNLQFWWNWVAGPYAGLVADVVPSRQQTTASAWLNVMSIVGSIAGSALMAIFYVHGQPLAMVLIFIAISLTCLLLTLLRVHEPPANDGPGAPVNFGLVIKSFVPPLKQNPNFYWVLATRFLAQMGIWSVFIFLLPYLTKVVGVARTAAPNIVSGLLGLGALIAIPAALVAVRVTARRGMVRVVQLTSWIMAAAAICYVTLTFHPYLALVFPIVIVFSAGYGAYLAADWALALRVLPNSIAAGKDMGIWHISLVLPQIIGPGATGWMITKLSMAVSDRLAYAVAFALGALWLILASVLVTRIQLSTDELGLSTENRLVPPPTKG
jgi:Na+/melibiose symporter-like transporter